MTQPIPPGAPTDGTQGDNTAVRTRQLKVLLETASPAEAGEAVRELMLLAASGGDAALELAVRYSCMSDCSTEELLRLWAIADGDPFGFCEKLDAPAYRARKAVRKLVSLSAPGDGGHALKLAARFTPLDPYASKFLIRLWRTDRDPDSFAEHLLAPAFRQEGRTELRLPYASSLHGLRHLTMLEKLDFYQCDELTDLTEVGELTGLTDLDLGGCTSVEDLTPIGRLSRLTRLDLSRCGAVENFEPLLNLSSLRQLRLSWTKVRSLRVFGGALAALESLDLRSCRSLTDLDGLAGLPNLTHLKLSGDHLRNLSPFAALPRLRSLELDNCNELTTLEGLDGHPRLAKLGIHGSPVLRTTEGLGDLPALRELTFTSCSALTDLKGLGRLPALRTLMINGSAVRDLGDLSGTPLTSLTLLYMEDLESLRALQDCSELRELTLRSLKDSPSAEGIPVERLSSLTVAGPYWTALKDITLFTASPRLAELDLRHCRSLTDLRPLLDMPALAHVHLAEGNATSPSGIPGPVVTELRARGVTVTLHR
ncbi:leucine-rich repeat domain-containing protein [Streptomyces viridosporus]|uniref:leucine-rich repeat domain-containing protein n=1 Tax=Streptomyces viridosporus TaxID=67581 RepID=UPI0020966F69|nr:leucine-rich repeat domain-containing protein [Streptomyces viridosporus]